MFDDLLGSRIESNVEKNDYEKIMCNIIDEALILFIGSNNDGHNRDELSFEIEDRILTNKLLPKINLYDIQCDKENNSDYDIARNSFVVDVIFDIDSSLYKVTRRIEQSGKITDV